MSTHDHQPDFRRNRLWFVAGWLVTFLVTGFLEYRRFVSAAESPSGPLLWLMVWDPETTLPFLLLAMLPVLVWWRRFHGEIRRKPARQTLQEHDLKTAGGSDEAGSRRRAFAGSVVVFLTAIACSWSIGQRTVSVKLPFLVEQVAFVDLPPAYHDEYSYLLQAQTFLNGHLSYPGIPIRPDLFHQMHVLNEYRTVSRYFPWTGVWIAPFLALQHPIRGHWLAGALAAVFFYLSMRQIISPRCGFPAALISGLLIAASPGISVFSNMLLAHHPTLLALSIFLYSFLRMMKTGSRSAALCAGIGLTLAMLGRPMTAAGFALPFGIWLATVLWRDRSMKPVPGFAVPLTMGFLLLSFLNHDATGSWTRSAYQEYTDTYTPAHRYGFNNAAALPETDSSKVITAYNSWATNLTPAGAIQNVGRRIVASLQWSLSITAILFGVCMLPPVLMQRLAETSSEPVVQNVAAVRAIAASVISLHLAHVPYWYDGIMHWHYVFETAPLLLMLTATGLAVAWRFLATELSRRMLTMWMAAFLAVSLLPGWVSWEPWGELSKTAAFVSEQSFARSRFHYFNRMTQQAAFPKPALVLIDERSADPQLSFVINPPDLQSDVLRCRRPATDQEIVELQQHFPDRSIQIFDPNSLTFSNWNSSTSSSQTISP